MDLLPFAVAGAGGGLVREIAQKGVEWLISLVGSHSPAVQAKAGANARNFLIRLARRVEALEAELPVGIEGVWCF